MGVDCYDKIYWSNSKTTPIWKILEKQHGKPLHHT